MDVLSSRLDVRIRNSGKSLGLKCKFGRSLFLDHIVSHGLSEI